MSVEQAHRGPLDLSLGLVTALVADSVTDATQMMDLIVRAAIEEDEGPLGLLPTVAGLSSLTSYLIGELAEACGVAPGELWVTLAPRFSQLLDHTDWPWGEPE